MNLKLLAGQLRIKPRTVCEVGVNKPELSQVSRFYGKCKLLLVEPLPKYAAQLKAHFPDAKVIQAAVADKNGPVALIPVGVSTYMEGLPLTPYDLALQKRKPGAAISVSGITFDTVDDGTIDIISIDAEGADWFVLKYMKSRPRILMLETHLTRCGYINPFIKEITAWMKKNCYSKLATEATDTTWLLSRRAK